MKTIGTYLRQARKKRTITLQTLSGETKIRQEFLSAIEAEEWHKLPEYPVVVGFVKNISAALEVNKDQAMAFLRRDYKAKQVAAPPKRTEIKEDFRWSPKLTFLLGVGGVLAMVAVYLVVQYVAFVRPPSLVVTQPEEGAVVFATEVVVSGFTDANTTVIVNEQPALVGDDGSFTTTVQINQNTTSILVRATSRSGKESMITRTIKPELNN